MSAATPISSESPLRRRIAVGCIIGASFTQALDQTIANVILPHMQGSLQADRAEVTWVLTSYIVAAAIMMPPTGWLAARFGEKNVLLFSLIGFTVTSALCGAAQSLDQMVLFRFLQGAVGAPMIAVAQSAILAHYPDHERPKIIGLWGTVTMLAPIVGPTFGGWLTDTFSWRWVFYINVPICVVAGLGITFALKLKPIPAPKQFDFFAFTTLILALGCLQLVLDRGIDQGWFESPEIILEAVIAGLGLYLFVVHLSTVGSTLFPDGLFRDRNFVSGTMLTFVNSCLLIASTALLPPFLQTLGGHTAMDVGMLLAPRGIGTLLAIQLVQRTIYRVDLRYVIIAGTLISTSSFWLMAHWTPDIDDFSIAVTALIQGAGMGFVVIPANIISFATLPRAQRTDGSALQNLARSMGGAIGVSIGAMVISTYSAVVHASIVEHVSPLNRALSLNAPGMMWNPMLPTGAEALEAMASRAATAVAYSDAFFLMFFLGLVPPVVVLLMKKPDRIVVPAEPILE